MMNILQTVVVCTLIGSAAMLDPKRDEKISAQDVIAVVKTLADEKISAEDVIAAAKKLADERKSGIASTKDNEDAEVQEDVNDDKQAVDVPAAVPKDTVEDQIDEQRSDVSLESSNGIQKDVGKLASSGDRVNWHPVLNREHQCDGSKCGCHNSYCWSYCWGSLWCYTNGKYTALKKVYVQCHYNYQCRKGWKCGSVLCKLGKRKDEEKNSLEHF